VNCPPLQAIYALEAMGFDEVPHQLAEVVATFAGRTGT
jgi:hypothetical protein